MVKNVMAFKGLKPLVVINIHKQGVSTPCRGQPNKAPHPALSMTLRYREGFRR
jgi:hypothetical protein